MKAGAILSVVLFGLSAAASSSPSSTPTSTKDSKCKRKLTSTTSTASATSKAPTTCNADNCARAVTGTVNGLATQAAHKSACSSFFQCTAFPATSTVTATATVFPVTQTATVYPQTVTQVSPVTTIATTDTTITELQTLEFTSVATLTDIEIETFTTTVASNAKRIISVNSQASSSASITSQAPSASVVCPTAVPTYASACSGTVRYSSACSCFGVSKSTVTATTPVTTVTVTATGQSVVTVSATKTVTAPTTVVTPATAFTTIATTVIDVVTQVVTVEQSTFVTATQAAPSGNAYCSNGQPVNGLSPSCTAAGCSTVNLRIEGASDTVYEGVIRNGPRYITTPSGGTHLCDGTNDGANPAPFENGISAIDAASQLCGFAYDGTFSSQFDDFFITKIGTSDSTTTANEYWGILNNFVFTSAGGCETEVVPTDNLLWAFNAFNVNFFLEVSPASANLAVGSTQVFTVTGHDGNGGNPVPISGAMFNGMSTDANGQVVYTATQPGTFRLKATRSDSIRSNAAMITVK